MSNKKDKFKFVEKVDTIIEDDIEEIIEEEKPKKTDVEEISEERKKQLKREKRKKIIKKYSIAIAVMVASTGIVFGLIMLWQKGREAPISMKITDALWLTLLLHFAAGWIMFVYNYNVLSPIIHGVRTFGLMIVGKKPSKDYYTYLKHIQENPLPRFYILVPMITSFILAIPAIILLVINFG